MSTPTHTGLETRLFIGGEWSDAAGARTFDVSDPFTGESSPSVAAASRGDAQRASRRPPTRSPRGRSTPPAARQAIFLKAADILESRRDEVVGLLARETGCTFGFGMFQMHFMPGPVRQAAGSAYAPVGEVIPSDVPGAMAMGLRQPVGVVGAIAPWNAALILSLRSITAPLVLGNTVVLKPSEWSPRRRRHALGRDLRRGGPAGRRAQHRHARAGRGGRRSATSSSRTRPCGGSTSRARPQTGRRLAEACGPAAEAGRARARRLEPADRARRTPISSTRSTRPPSARSCIRGRSACRPGGSSSSVRSPTHSPRSSSRRRAASRSATRRSTTRSSAR